tara:strand:- start:924 stop:1400 length:477 start_codon:yes stop_codon:yes gene_type:complete
MQMTLVALGKTQSKWIAEGIAVYEKRLKHYGKFRFVETPDIKLKQSKADPLQVMKAEALLLEKLLPGVDHLILLDERGKSRSSLQCAEHLRKLQNRGLKHAMWVIGGPYGFDESIRAKAHEFWSLSPMTFSHQMIRPFAIEQIYRAHTILKGEPYHHE